MLLEYDKNGFLRYNKSVSNLLNESVLRSAERLAGKISKSNTVKVAKRFVGQFRSSSTNMSKVIANKDKTKATKIIATDTSKEGAKKAKDLMDRAAKTERSARIRTGVRRTAKIGAGVGAGVVAKKVISKKKVKDDK